MDTQTIADYHQMGCEGITPAIPGPTLATSLEGC